MLKGFKDFIARGNVLELAVAVIMAGAFSPVVESITNVLMNIIGAVVGQPNFDSVFQFSINGSDPIQPGTILTALVNFLLVAAAVYFAIVVPMNKLSKKEEEAPAEPSDETKLLVEIRDLLASK